MAGGTIKAAILKDLNEPLFIDEIRLPNELSCGQALVKVHASGICGKQIDEIRGIAGENRYLPHLLGHEGGGVVKKIGPGITHIKEGDHVVMHWRKGAGIESAFPKYKWRDGMIGGGLVTTFNEYSVVSENRLTPISDDVPFEIAALMGCAVTTGLGVVNNEAKLKIGQSIAVFGCGGVGLNVIQGAAMVSAYPIFAFDIHNEKLRMAKRFGATSVFNLKKGSVAINYIDVAVECTGLSELIDQAYRMVAPDGRVILVGLPAHDEAVTLRSVFWGFGGKTMISTQGGQTNPTVDIPRYLRLYKEKKLKIKDLITYEYPLGDINDALDFVRSGRAGRCIVRM